MKAPNKIFVGFLFDLGFAISHASRERIREDDKEYISKDALLEWLEEELRNGGPATLVQHIINKLKSL